MSLTLHEYILGVHNKTIDPQQYLTESLDKVAQSTLNAFVRLHADYVQEHLTDASTLPLAGAPIGIKDNIFVHGYISSCGSHMLEKFVAPYTATCFDRLAKAGGLMLGKTNMDEFAMGTTNENSAFGPVQNPWASDRVAGGSSG